MASELEYDLRDYVAWGKMWLFDCNAGKTHLVLFDWFSYRGAIDVKMDGSSVSSVSSVTNTVVTSGLLPLVATWNC